MIDVDDALWYSLSLGSTRGISGALGPGPLGRGLEGQKGSHPFSVGDIFVSKELD